jgi:hypothetical protein
LWDRDRAVLSDGNVANQPPSKTHDDVLSLYDKQPHWLNRQRDFIQCPWVTAIFGDKNQGRVGRGDDVCVQRSQVHGCNDFGVWVPWQVVHSRYHIVSPTTTATAATNTCGFDYKQPDIEVQSIETVPLRELIFILFFLAGDPTHLKSVTTRLPEGKREMLTIASGISDKSCRDTIGLTNLVLAICLVRFPLPLIDWLVGWLVGWRRGGIPLEIVERRSSSTGTSSTDR